MNRDFAFAWKLLLPFLLAAEALALTGIAPAPLSGIVALASVPSVLLSMAVLLGHVHFLHAVTRPGWREYLLTAACGGVLFAVHWALHPAIADPSIRTLALLAAACLGTASLAAFGLRAALAKEISRSRARELLNLCLLIYIFGGVAAFYLQLTSSLHPATYDAIAFQIDATLGFHPTILANLLDDEWPLIAKTTRAVYVSLILGFLALYAAQTTGRKPLPVNIILVFLTSALGAWFIYHLCPIAGPRYLFNDRIPRALDELGQIPLTLGVVRPAPRNGMPSFHLAWALLLWMNACYLSRATRSFFAVFAALTALATLTLGEHYLVDLVAAVPAAIAMQAAYSRVLPWNAPERFRALLGGSALVLLWIASVRYGAEAFLAIPYLAWAAIIATLIASLFLHRELDRASRAAMNVEPVPEAARESAGQRENRRLAIYVGLMLALSGFAGLAYQVLFSKVLALTFGGTASATYTVLVTYMGGMAIGAWIGGRLAIRRFDALKLYAYCELAIGVYCIATPWIFQGIQATYVALATGMVPEAGALTLFRVFLGAAALSAPTVLMGMTLPILARFFEDRSASLGSSVALLYGANTAGAAFGALFAGYLVIPVLGVFKTTLAAALLNILVASLALRLFRRLPAEAEPAAPAVLAGPEYVAGAADRRLGQLALVILALGGLVTLALEVNYIHLLAVVAGNSVYAFSLMLFAFLIGLGAGAQASRWLLHAGVALPLALVWLEFTLAAVILAGVHLWAGLPEYFASFADYPRAREFGAREVVRGFVCLVAMFPPAVAIGALFPLATELVGRGHARTANAALGRAAAFNTAGNIAGVLLAGFVLLPWIGALRSVQLLAGLCFALALMLIVCTPLRRRAMAWAPAAPVIALLLAQPASFDYTALSSGANVYFMRQYYGQSIDHAESADGGLTSVVALDRPGEARVLTLLTNGKFQGSNFERGEMVAQAGVAMAPLLHTPHRERALVIGFGSGVSARTIKATGFRDMDIVDLSADILRLADTHFSNVNDRVLGKPGVHTHVTDGRNFLLLQDRSYDLISMEISSIWFAGAASLYNREFYRLAKRRLRPDGVLQQWMQVHHLQPVDMLYVIGSVRAEFSHVWLYYVGNQGVIVASNDAGAAPSQAHIARIDAAGELAPLLAHFGGTSRSLLASLVLDPAATDRFLQSLGLPASHWISTDDNLHLEYSTPRGNALDGARSREINLELLRRAKAG